MKPPKPFNVNNLIRNALRRAFVRHPVIREVLQAVRREVPKYNVDGSLAKKPSVQYLCNVCDKWHGSTHVQVDHIDPVVTGDGFVDWNEFIQRLFCDKANLQVICKTCHGEKSLRERAERAKNRYVLEITALELQLANKEITPKVFLKAIRKYQKTAFIGMDSVISRVDSLRKQVEAATIETAIKG